MRVIENLSLSFIILAIYLIIINKINQIENDKHNRSGRNVRLLFNSSIFLILKAEKTLIFTRHQKWG